MQQISTDVARGDIVNPGQEQSRSTLYIKLKGLTVSVVNSTPAEILLLSLYQIVLLKNDVSI